MISAVTLRPLNIVASDDHYLSWQVGDGGLLECCSHMLRTDNGDVWFVDPIDAIGLAEAATEFGRPAGVILLLDRHERDCERIAERFEIPLYVPSGKWRGKPPTGAHKFTKSIADSPFHGLRVVQRNGFWIERALWWPEKKTLIIAEALGSAAWMKPDRSDHSLAVHPMLRLTPPDCFSEIVQDVDVVLPGHGSPIQFDGGAMVELAVSDSVLDIPGYALAAPRHLVRWARAAVGVGLSKC